jgi:xylitol oxidase
MERLGRLERHLLAGCCPPAVPPPAAGASAAAVSAAPPLGESRGKEAYQYWDVQNWTGSVQWNAGSVAVPASLSELQTAVRTGAAPIRVVGRGHSFTPIVECAGGTLISLSSMKRVLNFQPPVIAADGTMLAEGRLRVEGGTTMEEAIEYLKHQQPPCALKNLPSVPQATIAGAVSTGTHGSGINNENLASHVTTIEFVTADGSLESFSRDTDPDRARGAAVNVGALGVVSSIEVEAVPWFTGRNFVFTARFNDLLQTGLAQLTDSNAPLCDSWSLMIHDWTVPDPDVRLLLKTYDSHWDPSIAAPVFPDPEKDYWGENNNVFGDTLWETGVAIPPSPEHRKKDLSYRGPYHDTVSAGVDDWGVGEDSSCGQQAEFFVPMAHAWAALQAVRPVLAKWSRGFEDESPATTGLLHHVELRCVKGDSGWLSPQPVDCLAIHLNMNGLPARLPEVEAQMVELEGVLAQFDARPHWAKLAPHTFNATRLEQLYGKAALTQFRAMARKHDPQGKFLNAWMTEMLFTE